jgi:hypothetical protein
LWAKVNAEDESMSGYLLRFTGDFVHHTSMSTIKHRAKMHGAKTVEDITEQPVSGEINLSIGSPHIVVLVVGARVPNQSMIRSARNAKVPIITEEGFVSWCQEGWCDLNKYQYISPQERAEADRAAELLAELALLRDVNFQNTTKKEGK